MFWGAARIQKPVSQRRRRDDFVGKAVSKALKARPGGVKRVKLENQHFKYMTITDHSF